MVASVDFHRSSELFVVCILSNMKHIPSLFEDAKSVSQMKIDRSRAYLPFVKRIDLDGSFFNQLEDPISPQRRQI